jgi:hypothetical protein
VQDLALEVVSFNPVKISEADRTDSSRGEVKSCRAAKTAGADDEDSGAFEPFLSFETDFRQDDVSAVSRGFCGREWNPFWHMDEQIVCCCVGNPSRWRACGCVESPGTSRASWIP